ncbi:hypothetical protein Mgra_00007838 [Meloidogyne graminicola]|uniref:Uncharacterized protein n=1 Tax=Meloidogyne graminicola TaxID=189291 RepID=A0A8S9ZHH5_9BILA|nr:hypothetical protein Mgra_00007838 [Meloidogyne graminicola]
MNIFDYFDLMTSEYSFNTPSNFLSNLSLNSSKCECVDKLLYHTASLIKRTSSSQSGNERESFENKWAQLFKEYILDHEHCNSENCTSHHDDMLWFVPITKVANASTISTDISHLQVFRRQSRNKPSIGDRNVNWHETLCLNLILQQLDYFVTCAVCTKNSPTNMQIHRKNFQRVYPSPSRRRMDAKGECEEITYPKIYFAIDSFDEVFNDMIISEGECICVELIARDRNRNIEAVIFLGSIRYDILKKLYDSRNAGTWNWAQRWMNAGKQRHEFVKMRGPRGKGFAEMAVTKVAGCGFDTPMSENGFDLNGGRGFGGYDRRLSDTGGGFFSRLISTGSPRNSFFTGRFANKPGINVPPSVTPTVYAVGQRASSRWFSDGEQNTDDEGADIVETSDSRSLAGNVAALVNKNSWSMRQIGNTLQMLKEKTEQPEQLQAFLTYITLPWLSILDDILATNKRKAILTFDFHLQKPPGAARNH